MSSDRIMQWRLLLEEYGITLRHIKGSKNTVADALSRHPIDDKLITEKLTHEEKVFVTSANISEAQLTLAKVMAVKPLNTEKEFPMEMSVLREEQQKERKGSNTEFRKYFMKKQVKIRL